MFMRKIEQSNISRIDQMMKDVARLLGLSVEFPLLAGWLREKLSNLQDDDKFSLHEERW